MKWKVIDEFPNYEVSDEGLVRTIKTGHIHQPYERNAYLAITLRKDGKTYLKTIHRLVAQAFIDNPNGYPIVNHKDEDKHNNNVDNLEWCDYSYNATYGTAQERHSKTTTRDSIYQFDLKGNFIREWKNGREVERELGFNNSAIYLCCSHKPHYHTAYGYIWKYKSEC